MRVEGIIDRQPSEELGLLLKLVSDFLKRRGVARKRHQSRTVDGCNRDLLSTIANHFPSRSG